MLFGPGYDKSLWLMLKTDKKNRAQLLSFIKSIPPQLFYKLREELKRIDGRKNADINCEYLSENGEYFICDYCLGDLKIIKSKKDGEDYDLTAELYISNFDDNFDLKMFTTAWLGNFAYDLDVVSFNHGYSTDGENSEYDIINTPMGYFIDIHKDNDVKRKFSPFKSGPKDLQLRHLKRFEKRSNRKDKRKSLRA